MFSEIHHALEGIDGFLEEIYYVFDGIDDVFDGIDDSFDDIYSIVYHLCCS